MHGAAWGMAANEDAIDTALRLIAVAWGSEEDWVEKYGTDVETDTFMMHHYCWCEKPDCLWCCIWLRNEVDCSEAEAKKHRDNHVRLVREKYGDWAAKHPGAPHFWYKPSGFQLRWYKYIGRDMEASADSIPADFLAKCLEGNPRGLTVETAIGELSRRTEETRDDIRRMMNAVNASVSRKP